MLLFLSIGPGLRASSPETCISLVLEVLSAGWSLVGGREGGGGGNAMVALMLEFQRLCSCMYKSAQAVSLSVHCLSVELACEHQQFNQTSKRTCIGGVNVCGVSAGHVPFSPRSSIIDAFPFSNAVKIASM